MTTQELTKAIAKLGNEYYTEEDFKRDAKIYIQAIKEGRMLCTIQSVAKSGMSRVLKFNSCEIGDSGRGWYRQYNMLFKVLGYKEKDYGFRVSGCGMDMVFHTNYCNIRDFYNLGLIDEEECDKLSQMTPTVL